ncbi:MAG: hypothetical protein QF913_07840 [Nitrospinaceae bacterium]|jgi:hypothetical protein|nr:hypothetical protein [Nitrospinaceae bacterium]
MARRLFNDTEWTPEALRLMIHIRGVVDKVLRQSESAGPLDLRDFHYVVSSAVSEVVAETSIRRRLSDELDR